MAGVVTKFEFGPITYPVGAAVTGGQFVMPGSGGTAGTVIPATNGALTVLGVAKTDAAPEPSVPTTPSVAIDVHIPRGTVAVAHIGAFYFVANGAIAFGDLVACAGGNEVKTVAAAGATYAQAEVNNNDRSIVGVCISTAGAADDADVLIQLRLA